MKKRSIAIFLATVMISLTACAGSSEADNSSKEPAKEEEQQTSEGKTHLTVWTGYPDNNDWLEWVTAEFEKENADIDVEVTTFPITDFENKIAAAIPAGSCSDVISVNPSFVYAFNSTGKFAQVPEELQELVNSGIYDDAVALESSYQGAVVSVPHMLSNAAWFYNKDYFEEAGLEDVPHSLNEVLEYAQKLAKYDDNGKLPVKQTVIFTENIRRTRRQHLKRCVRHDLRITDERQRLLCRKRDLHIVKDQGRYSAHQPIHRGSRRHQHERPSGNVTEIAAEIIDRTGSDGNDKIGFPVIGHGDTAKGMFVGCQISVLRTPEHMGSVTDTGFLQHFFRLFPGNLMCMRVGDQIWSCISQLPQKSRQLCNGARFKQIVCEQ